EDPLERPAHHQRLALWILVNVSRLLADGSAGGTSHLHPARDLGPVASPITEPADRDVAIRLPAAHADLVHHPAGRILDFLRVSLAALLLVPDPLIRSFKVEGDDPGVFSCWVGHVSSLLLRWLQSTAPAAP